MQGLGLLAVDRGLGREDGSRLRPVGRTAFLGPASAGDLPPGLAGRADRHAIQPGPERIRVADRPGLARQDEEGGLEGVLGVVVIAEQLPADAQDHRAVSRHDGGEGGLITDGREPLEQLTVPEAGGRADREERPELPGQRW